MDEKTVTFMQRDQSTTLSELEQFELPWWWAWHFIDGVDVAPDRKSPDFMVRPSNSDILKKYLRSTVEMIPAGT
jgi:hypothetical protein